MKVLFATGNAMKLDLMKNRLKAFNEIEIVSPKMIGLDIDVVEDGKTPEENAIKKAVQYYEATKMPTIAEDSGLYIDKFSEEEQPGLFVKRVNGIEGLSDEEVLQYYIDKLKEHGGSSLAHYESGVCMIDENGGIASDLIKERDFLLTTMVDEESRGIKGGVLDCISFDIDANKYFAYCTSEDKSEHYKILDSRHCALVKKHLLKK